MPAPASSHHKIKQALLLKGEMRDVFERRNAMMSEMRTRYHQEREVRIPENYKQIAREVRLPILSDLIDLMTAIVDDAQVRIHVDPYDVGPTAERNSSLRERWSEAMLQKVQDELGRPVLTNCTFNQMSDGLGILKVLYRPDHWVDLPTSRKLFGKKAGEMDEQEVRELGRAQDKAKRGGLLPFSIVDVDPITYFPGHGPDGTLEYVIELTERPIRSVLAQYGDKVSYRNGEVRSWAALGDPRAERQWDTSSDPRARIQVWEYTDREDHITFVEDVDVKAVKHRMGEVPYFPCYAKPSASREPERYSRPNTYKLGWLLDLLDSFWTMMSNAGYLYSYPTPVTITPAGVEGVPPGPDGRPDAAEFEVGKHLVLYQGQEFQFVAPPAEHLQLMAGLIDQATRMVDMSSGLGPAIRGVGGADQPGYALNQLMQASMLSLHPAIKSRDRMLSNVVAFVWRLIEKRIDGDVWVWGTEPDKIEGGSREKGRGKKWLKLGPSDIDGYYRVDVETKPLVDQMRISRGQFAAAMKNEKMMSRRRAIEEYLSIEDPEAEMDAIAIDEATEEGPLADLWKVQAMRRAGLPTPQEAQQMVQQALPPPAPDGTVPQPGMPQELPPAGPGQGMPLEPPVPDTPGPTEGQLADTGTYAGSTDAAPGGRAAGAERMPPGQMPPSMMGG